MNEGNRAWGLIRGYAGKFAQEWERVSSIDVVDAERELSDSLDNPPGVRTTPSSPSYQTPVERTNKSADADWTPEQKLEQALKIIGVSDTAAFSEVRKTYERLMKRCDPTNFAEGSIEAAQASTIRKRVEWAYNVISSRRGSTEKRFGSLEID